MGHVHDVGRVKQINFPYIELENSYNGRCEGYFHIDDSCYGTINEIIWIPGTPVVGDFQEIEDNGAGYIVAILQEMYDAWIKDDNEKWKEFYNNGWSKHLNRPEFKPNSWDRICTVRQLCVTPVSKEEYDIAVKYNKLKDAYEYIRNEISSYVQENNNSLPPWFGIRIQELCKLADEKTQFKGA